MPKFDRSQIPDFVLDSTIIQSMLGSAAMRTAGPIYLPHEMHPQLFSKSYVITDGDELWSALG
jgi:hypothetical protein